MADTAAFFAKKKKGGKKKSFKAFNANKIDATAISSTVHVDAPAISGTTVKALDLPLSANGIPAENTANTNDPSHLSSYDQKDDEGWEDTSAAPITRTSVVATNKNTVTELLDMNALEERRREQDDVVERMRVEETKAALAAAREGMEKEAQRLKDAQEKKKQEQATSASNDGRVGGTGAGAGMGGGDGKGKWVPVHLRNKTSAALGNSRMMMSKARGKSAIPDTGDAMDFPDLASANAAIEAQKKLEKERQEKEKERQRMAAKPSGIKSWGASRSSLGGAPPVRKKIEVLPASTPKVSNPSPAPKKVEPSPKEPGPTKVEKEPVATPAPTPTPTPAASAPTPTPAPAAPAPTPAPTLKKKKKKKKDLSTFKASS